MRLAVGVDTGGTFTDLVAVDLDNPTAGPLALKVPSTRADPSEAVEAALRALARQLDGGLVVGLLAHGTTVATNALLEGKFGRVGMITNSGFADVVEIARQRRPDLYDLDVGKPTPIAPRSLRLEVIGRMGPEGDEWEPLDDASVLRAAAKLREARVEAIAVCLLHSYANPAHEKRVRDILLREVPEASVTISSEVMPEWREYERFSTTLVNAASMPVVDQYLRRLVQRATELAIGTTPLIMQSNGGLASVDRVVQLPMTSLYSGPSAGVIGAAAVAARVGHPDAITLDVGGTSSDVCLIESGKPAFLAERAVAGHAVKVDSLAVQSIGAGGGSIISVDAGGFIQVGPESAGADPGPACYGKGGTRPTITDASVILGRLDPEVPLGGSVLVDVRAARIALAPVAASLGCDIEEAASMALTVMTANITQAIKLISLDRGHDPRAFALVAFGGAGAMHAADVAQELGMGYFIIPPRPGVLCAVGLLGAPARADFRKTLLIDLIGAAAAPLTEAFQRLEAHARSQLAGQTINSEDLTYSWAADVSFGGQDHELTVSVDAASHSLDADVIADAFKAQYSDAYGYIPPNAVVRVVNTRITAHGPAALDVGDLNGQRPRKRSEAIRRKVYFADHGGWCDATIVSGAELVEGERYGGPVIIQQDDSTIVIPPTWTGIVAGGGTVKITRQDG